MNPNIAKEAHKGAAARTPEGKLRVSLNSWKGGKHSPSNKHMHKIPESVKELFTWYKEITVKERNYLFEMKGIYEVLKGNTQNNEILLDKIKNGKPFSPLELEQFKLLINTLEKLQKLEFGEKRINVNASYKDIRDRMFPDDN